VRIERRQASALSPDSTNFNLHRLALLVHAAALEKRFVNILHQAEQAVELPGQKGQVAPV